MLVTSDCYQVACPELFAILPVISIVGPVVVPGTRGRGEGTRISDEDTRALDVMVERAFRGESLGTNWRDEDAARAA